jgi:hypothetical protein
LLRRLSVLSVLLRLPAELGLPVFFQSWSNPGASAWARYEELLILFFFAVADSDPTGCAEILFTSEILSFFRYRRAADHGFKM